MNTRINKEVTLIDWGYIDYETAWGRQEKLFKETIDLKIANRSVSAEEQQLTPNYLVFCEHPHVYTLGKSGSADHLLIDKERLREKQASYFEINRGGDITYHGPGQLVCYPIFDLDNFFTDIHKYLRTLEEAIIQVLNDYGLRGDRVEGLTGVWIDANGSRPRKICAMGVKSSRWVTMHGFALNVNTDLSYFNHIVPCGISDKAVTSMAVETGKSLDITDVMEKATDRLSELFGFFMVKEPDQTDFSK